PAFTITPPIFSAMNPSLNAMGQATCMLQTTPQINTINLNQQPSFSIVVQESVPGVSNIKSPVHSYTFTLSQAQTAVVLSPFSNTVYGQPVAFTATVTSQGSPVVSSGTVTFKEGNTSLGSPVPVGPSGQAILTITSPPPTAGQHTITAYYSGTGLFA